MRNYLVLGQWNSICDRCGFKYKSAMLQREWTGLMVCSYCLEPRHPQDFLRVAKEQISPPWARPEPQDTFITFNILMETGDDILTETGDNITTEMG